VDFGTATNFEVIDEGGRYLGGVITPGISISTDALFARAARLPRVGIERPHNVIGTSTVTAIQSGLYYGYAGLVDGILRRMIEELGRRPRVVATGGLAPLIATASEFIDEVDLTLTLDGLRLVYERVRGASASEVARERREACSPTTIDEIIARLNDIIDEALRAESRIGYFAALYERVTTNVRRALVAGDVFKDNPRMERLDVIFAEPLPRSVGRVQRGPTADGVMARGV
jgi:hypothetical protein